jgi:hypothetical protein
VGESVLAADAAGVKEKNKQERNKDRCFDCETTLTDLFVCLFVTTPLVCFQTIKQWESRLLQRDRNAGFVRVKSGAVGRNKQNESVTPQVKAAAASFVFAEIVR